MVKVRLNRKESERILHHAQVRLNDGLAVQDEEHNSIRFTAIDGEFATVMCERAAVQLLGLSPTPDVWVASERRADNGGRLSFKTSKMPDILDTYEIRMVWNYGQPIKLKPKDFEYGHYVLQAVPGYELVDNRPKFNGTVTFTNYVDVTAGHKKHFYGGYAFYTEKHYQPIETLPLPDGMLLGGVHDDVA